MKKAFLISAYTDSVQLGNLIDTLEDKDHWFFIHIDKNVDIIPFKKITDGKQNVNFVTNRYTVNWGGIRRSFIRLSCCALA